MNAGKIVDIESVDRSMEYYNMYTHEHSIRCLLLHGVCLSVHLTASQMRGQQKQCSHSK